MLCGVRRDRCCCNRRDKLGGVRSAWSLQHRSGQALRLGSGQAGRAPESGTTRSHRQIIGRRVWDSRGRPTVEAEIVLAMARGGADCARRSVHRQQRGVDLRDGGRRSVGSVSTARSVTCPPKSRARCAECPCGSGSHRPPAHRSRRHPNKARLGANAIVAVSMAARMPRRRRTPSSLAPSRRRCQPLLPMPMVQIFGGGAHAGRRVDIQDFLVMPIGASTFDEAISMAVRIYESAGRIMAERGGLRGVADEGGWWPEFSSNSDALDALLLAIERADLRPGIDAAIAIDVAASQLRDGLALSLRSENREMSSDELADSSEWCRRYPIVSIEDPLAQDDDAGMRAFTARAGEPPAGHRRRLSRHVGRSHLGRGGSWRVQCGAAEAQPVGNDHRNESGASTPRAPPAGRRSCRRARAKRKMSRSCISPSAGPPVS